MLGMKELSTLTAVLHHCVDLLGLTWRPPAALLFDGEEVLPHQIWILQINGITQIFAASTDRHYCTHRMQCHLGQGPTQATTKRTNKILVGKLTVEHGLQQE